MAFNRLYTGPEQQASARGYAHGQAHPRVDDPARAAVAYSMSELPELQEAYRNGWWLGYQATHGRIS
jgi:hypothetical protein